MINVSTLISPSILNNLELSKSPEAFGDQISILQNNIGISNYVLEDLYKEKESLIQEGINIEKNHSINIQTIENNYKPSKKIENGNIIEVPPKLTEEQYQESLKVEYINYEIAIKNLQVRKDKNQKDIDLIIKDPFKNQKEKIKNQKEKRDKFKSKNQRDKFKSKNQKKKIVLDNNRKTLVPLITLLLSNKISEIIIQNNSIKLLIEKTNEMIEKANISNDILQINNAKLARDNTIKIIQSNEEKINSITNQINIISNYIRIFNIIVQVLTNISIPTSVPPGAGVPIGVILKLVQLLDKANRILLALSAFLPVIVVSLQKAIDLLNEYKSELLMINGVIETVASNTLNLNNILGLNYGDLGEYKGFKFVLKEENNPKFVVKGNKRHYAVAINKQNIEQLKSDYSFTLDPNDLIAQLKLIIDQQNLQG